MEEALRAAQAIGMTTKNGKQIYLGKQILIISPMILKKLFYE